MEMMTYTNAQLRSILNGLGYTRPDDVLDAAFPLSIEDSPLTNPSYVQAIQKFQLDHQLEVNGTLDSITLKTIQTVMQALISDLNQANYPGLPLDHPVYDATTIAAVKLVQQRLPADGIASHSMQVALTKRQPQSLPPLPHAFQNSASSIFLHHGDDDW